MSDNKIDNDKLFSQESDRHCIWMKAGVISFKLCPIYYDCEHCDFDDVFSRNRLCRFSLENT